MHVVSKSKEFETAVYELGFHFGFFKRPSFCETILRFYPDDGPTNDVKYRTGGLGVHVLLPCHPSPLWTYSYPGLKSLTYADDGGIIGPLSDLLSKVLSSKKNSHIQFFSCISVFSFF
jgi:hypothetical protein